MGKKLAGENNSGRDYVYKERTPQATVSRIAGILEKLGIGVTLSDQTNNLDMLYSCRLSVDGLPCRTFGKSYTREFAEASAYGELMERLQNQLLYRHVEFSPAARGSHGFQKDAREKVVSGRAIPDLPEDFRRANVEEGRRDLFSLWREHRKQLRARGLPVTLVPFFNVRDRAVTYLPSEFITDFFGSNGMCAGNTPEEALDQGLSEICERYVQRELYSREITPPDVPEDYIREKAPVQFAIIEELRRKGGYKIVVKDCSLGRGFPVLGVIFFQPSSGHHWVNLGASPIWQVALERCLTEAFQGFSVGGSWKLSPVNLVPPFSHKRDTIKNYVNYINLVCTEVGHYPPALFNSKPTYKFKPFKEKAFRSQAEKLDYLVRFIRRTGCNIYIRDVSVLGWPAYDVVAPGLSELLNYSPQGWKEILTSYSRVEAMSGIDRLSAEKLRELVEDMKGFILATLPIFRPADPFVSLANYLRVPGQDKSSWQKASLRMICAVLAGSLRDWATAHEQAAEYVAAMEAKYGTGPDQRKHWVRSVIARDWFGLRAAGVTGPEAAARLERAYDAGLVRQALAILDCGGKPSALLGGWFAGLPLPRCWDCDNCGVRPECLYGELEKLHLRMKQAASEADIDQMRLGEVVRG